MPKWRPTRPLFLLQNHVASEGVCDIKIGAISLGRHRRRGLRAVPRQQLRGARQAAQAAIVEAEQEVDRLYREALAEAEAEANRTREKARREIEAQRETAQSQLMGQVDQLSAQIIKRLLAA